MALSYQRLAPEKESDIRAYQVVLEQAPNYYLTVEGHLPESDTAKKDLLLLPEGKGIEDKYSFLILDRAEAVGCMDILRGYPFETTAYIGLLLLAESHQGRGLGAQTLAYVRSLVQSWGCTHLRIAVISTNVRAFGFWQREGFGEIERGSNSRFIGESVVMEAALPRMAIS
ncbi:MAG: GNAT family N-acetyltransferase [Oceanococcus sp.]